MAVPERSLADETRTRHRAFLVFGPVGVVLGGCALLLGGITPETTQWTAVLVALALAWALSRGRAKATVLALGLLALCVAMALQCLPIPSALLSELAPESSTVWTETLRLLAAAPRGVVSAAPVSLDPGGTRLDVLRYASYAAFACVCVGSSSRRSTGLSTCVFAAALLLGLVSLFHQLAGATSVFGWYRPRHTTFVAPIMNANALAAYLNLGFFCGAGLLFDSRTGARARAALQLGCVILVAMMVWAGSRGAVLTFVLGLAVLGVMMLRRRNIEPTLSSWSRLVLVLLLGVGFAAFSLGRLRAQLFDTSTQKLELFSAAWSAAMRCGAAGCGRGAFGAAIAPHLSERTGRGSFEHAENWGLQWAVESGWFVAVVVVLSTAWLLWPSRELRRSSFTRLGAFVALLVLFTQNLMDFSLEVPAVMLAAIACASAAYGFRTGELRWRQRWQSGFVGLGLASALLWTWFEPVTLSRMARHRVAARAEAGSLSSVELDDVLRAHPADPYLLRIRAATAVARREANALGWVGWAIERDPISGVPLLILAEALHVQGAEEQALSALRRAASLEPDLAAQVAERAFRWTSDRVLGAVPEGTAGARVLDALADRSEDPIRRLRYRWMAFEREPASSRWKRLALTEVLTATDTQCEIVVGVACMEFAERHIDGVNEGAPGWVELHALLRARRGEKQAAMQWLEKNCPRTFDGLRCLQLWWSLSRGTNPEQLLEVSDILLGLVCGDAALCAEWEGRIGTELAALGERHRALPHFERAASLVPSVARWVQVARIAVELSDRDALQLATRKIRRLGGELPPDLVRRTQKLLLQPGSSPGNGKLMEPAPR